MISYEISKLLNVTAQTLRNWDKSGKLKPHHTTHSGYRYYSQEQLNRILGVKDTTRRVLKKQDSKNWLKI